MATSKSTQVSAQLQQIGIEPTSQAIESVMEILRTDGRATVVTACKRYANQFESANTNHNQNQSTGSADLGDAANFVADRIVEEVVGTAYDLALNRIASGDWGKLRPSSQKKLEDFKKFVKTDLKVIDVNFTSAALPTSQQNLLPSSELIDNELITQ